MLSILISIFGIFITIFFVIGTHEAAHFIAARLLNVKVLRFSIGFGKALWRWHDKKGTEYVFALIPLGGYVKMLDENEGDVPPAELPYAFNRQPFYKKFIIVLAGPAINIFCAFALYWLIFVIGFVNIKPIIGNVAPSSIAAQAGLQTGQQIIRVDDKKTPGWINILYRLLAHTGDKDQVKIETKTRDQTQTHLLDLADWKMDDLTPDPFNSLGITPFEPPIPLVIGVIAKHSPAENSALKVGDTIIAINQKPIKDWQAVITHTMEYPGQTIPFTVKRNGKVMTLPITVGIKHDWLWHKYGYLGVGPRFEWPKELLQKIQYGPVEALYYAGQQLTDLTYFNLLLFWKMVTGKVSLQSLGGPITIFESAGDALNYGFLSFLSFLAFLSVSIGIINLFPIPGLDGGHLLIQLIETIIRRPLPERFLAILYQIGFFFIIFLLIQALVNDVLRLY